MMDLKKLRQLIKLMVDNDLTELDIQQESERVTLKRGSGEPTVSYVAGPPVAPGSLTTSAGNAEPPESDAEVLSAILSPMVGTFYAASTPDSKPFVTVGEAIEPQTVVCIIEAMKVFNEVQAEVHGLITKVLVDNGQAVEFDQPLFMIKPA